MFARLLLGGVLVAVVTFSAGANAKDSPKEREGDQDFSQGQRLINEGRQDIRHGQTSEGLLDISRGQRLINEGHHDHEPGPNHKDSPKEREGDQDISQGQRLINEGRQDIRHGQISEGLLDISQGQRLINEGHHDHEPVSEH